MPAGWAGNPAIPVNSTAALPAQSLNGNINTLLVNNVITSQITPDLKFKASYRFYDYDNGTPELRFADWILTDVASAKAFFGFLAPVQSISISYNRQNAGSELTWRPSREWNFGAAYAFERYNWVRADVNATNENSGKVYVDWKPVSWVTARASVLAAQRRYDNYNYLDYVGMAQWPTGANVTQYSTAYRQFMFDNRDRTRAQASLAVDVFHGVTLTPTFSMRDDQYRLDPTTEVGLQSDKRDVRWRGARMGHQPGHEVSAFVYERPPEAIDLVSRPKRSAVSRQSILHRTSGRYAEHLYGRRHASGDPEHARRDVELQPHHLQQHATADLCQRQRSELRAPAASFPMSTAPTSAWRRWRNTPSTKIWSAGWAGPARSSRGSDTPGSATA